MKHSRTIIAMLAIFILILVAMLKDINGAVLAAGLCVLAGLGGFEIGKRRSSDKNDSSKRG